MEQDPLPPSLKAHTRNEQEGSAVEQDPRMAASLFQQAADQGHVKVASPFFELLYSTLSLVTIQYPVLSYFTTPFLELLYDMVFRLLL